MWTLLPSERLRCWQDFRKDIGSKTFEQALQDTQHLWSYAPYVAHYLTTDHIEEWPGPWELIYENFYCDLAKALGIVYTLYLSEHRPNMEIHILSDLVTKEQINAVLIQGGKYVLNYIHDEIVNKEQMPPGLKLVKKLTVSDLGLDKLQ
jgi:hypothetical protein